jgi:deoxyribose-phosphate aldolase
MTSTIPVAALAKYIDHALLQPAQSDSDFDAGCDVACEWGVAALCVKSADVVRAKKRTEGSGVAVCAVVGFPHSNAPTDVICYEAKRALESGASEIDAVVSLSRVLSRDWDAVREQIGLLNQTTVQAGGALKVIFETGLIGERDAKVRLCEICRELRVAYVKTSTGFAVGRGADGGMMTLGATLDDVALLVENAGPTCKTKASGGIRRLAEALAFIRVGASRLGTTSTAEILGEALLAQEG